MQLKIEPIKIQLLLSIYFPDWFANWTSEPIGFWKDFMINQLKLMFKKKLFPILKRLNHLKMPLYETLYHKTGRRRKKLTPSPPFTESLTNMLSLRVCVIFLSVQTTAEKHSPRMSHDHISFKISPNCIANWGSKKPPQFKKLLLSSVERLTCLEEPWSYYFHSPLNLSLNLWLTTPGRQAGYCRLGAVICPHTTDPQSGMFIKSSAVTIE